MMPLSNNFTPAVVPPRTQAVLNELPQDVRNFLVDANAGPITQAQLVRLRQCHLSLKQMNNLLPIRRFFAIVDDIDAPPPPPPETAEARRQREEAEEARSARYEANRTLYWHLFENNLLPAPIDPQAQYVAVNLNALRQQVVYYGRSMPEVLELAGAGCYATGRDNEPALMMPIQ